MLQHGRKDGASSISMSLHDFWFQLTKSRVLPASRISIQYPSGSVMKAMFLHSQRSVTGR